MPEMEIDTTCPACGGRPMVERYSRIDIPYFDEAFEASLRCRKCDYTSTDVLITSVKEPMRVEYVVESPGDLDARVIRSTSGTVTIPELGFMLEPGTAPESFVSNVEGVLVRFRKVLEMALRFSTGNFEKDMEEAINHRRCEKILSSIREEHARKVRRGAALQKYLQEIMEGKKRIILAIEDPFGNSMIIPRPGKDVKKTRLTEEEIARLNKGLTILDLDELGEIKEKIEGRKEGPVKKKDISHAGRA